jgi:tRNA threonylcarbamoyladenosine biosynthesis protein TsaB
MRVLALDTSGLMGGVCLFDAEGVLGDLTIRVHRGHASCLHELIRRLMDTCRTSLSELDGVAITIGPGSFTGLRIGLSAAKGLAYALGKPLVGVSTLEALAANVAVSSLPVFPTLDARKGQVFVAEYRRSPEGGLSLRGREGVMGPELLFSRAAELESAVFVGDGALKYAAGIREALGDGAVIPHGEVHQVRAREVGRIGYERLMEGRSDSLFHLVPNYLRKSEAELRLSEKRIDIVDG